MAISNLITRVRQIFVNVVAELNSNLRVKRQKNSLTKINFNLVKVRICKKIRLI